MLSFRRSFTVSPEALASGHPYSFDSSSRSCAVSFFEFRGTGPPSSDVGYPGDVYVDLTPEQHTLYWRDRLGNGPGRWNRWTALLLDRIPLYKYLVSHPWAKDPQESDLYLWADSNGITWASKEEICASRVAMIQRGIATVMPGTIPDVEALVAEILEKMIEKEDDKVSPRIRATDRSDEKNTSNHRPNAGSSRRSISSPNPYSLSKAFPPPRSPSPVESYPSPSLRRDKGLDPPHFGPTLPPIRSPPPTSTMSYTSSQHTRPPRLASPPLPSCSDLRRSITTPPNYHLPPPPPLDYPAYNGAISANSGSQERSTNSSAQHGEICQIVCSLCIHDLLR
ncbi:hypothetical protein C8J57DRAFT_1367055 [Mycena rebaudengoi]|nr:hypothetical protein C8J57DRAFT_1367055 [Mycena rebaudengoi]